MSLGKDYAGKVFLSPRVDTFGRNDTFLPLHPMSGSQREPTTPQTPDIVDTRVPSSKETSKNKFNQDKTTEVVCGRTTGPRSRDRGRSGSSTEIERPITHPAPPPPTLSDTRLIIHQANKNPEHLQ